ncbi:hypothetical protein [Weissella confusa]|nr:hypothetical protein [Weissella confusa]
MTDTQTFLLQLLGILAGISIIYVIACILIDLYMGALVIKEVDD